MKYFAKIKYVGTDFHGFQYQPNARTVQGVLTDAFCELFFGKAKITGCSRTDAGVHANEYCMTVECEGATVPAEKLPVAIMRYLPKDVAVVYAEVCEDCFHPRYSVKSKEYLYRIVNTRTNDPFEADRAWFVPKFIGDEEIALMRSAAEYMVGYKDFASFMAEGSDVADTCRNLMYIDISKNEDLISFKVCADGFLYNMVRIIVGTLIDVAFGRISPEQIPKIIDSKNRALAGMTAPPEGLYLNRVDY